MAVDQQLLEPMQQATVVLHGLPVGTQTAGQVLKEVGCYSHLQAGGQADLHRKALIADDKVVKLFCLQ